MSCPCKLCNGLDPLVTFFGGCDLKVIPEEDLVTKSVHDRLDELHDYLSHHRIPEKYMDELVNIMEEVSNIDDEILKLKAQNLAFPVEVELGEISKKLY